MANITTQTIRVDLSTDKVIPSAFTHQNDTARTLVFDMYNGGMPYTMTGNTVKFAYKSPIVNGQYSVIAGSSMASGTVSGNKVSVTLPVAYTQISGVGMLTMVITPTSGTVRPVNIRLVVQKSADGDDVVVGASDFPTYVIDEIGEALANYGDNQEVIEQAVSDWLDDHPEATTTVQDGSITANKLTAQLKNNIVAQDIPNGSDLDDYTTTGLYHGGGVNENSDSITANQPPIITDIANANLGWYPDYILKVDTITTSGTFNGESYTYDTPCQIYIAPKHGVMATRNMYDETEDGGTTGWNDWIVVNSDDGIQFESGETDDDIYTIITVPKSRYKMTLEALCDDPDDTSTIDEYVRREKPFLAMNISNTGDFVFNGTQYGTSCSSGSHGSVYALKADSVDFDVLSGSNTQSDVIAQGYIASCNAWSCLRLNGVNQTIDTSYATFANPNPRQTLAWDENNWYIYTSYSRVSYFGDASVDNKFGLTMMQVQTFCANRGWPNVAALDGGGSIYIASGKPYRRLAKNINNGYWRDAHLCIAFNEKVV